MTVRISKKITDRAADLTAAVKADRANAHSAARDFIHHLRSDAHFAYLDDKVARYRALTKIADRLSEVVLRHWPRSEEVA